jgi:proline iminopeptidase
MGTNSNLRGVLAAVVTTVALVPLIAATRERVGPSSATSLPSSVRVKTGGAQWVKVDGEHLVWTRRVGTGPIKLLLLPGGPGCSHEYFEVFEDFLPQRGVELIYYDPLGTGGSDRPDDPSLWTMPHFVEEVERVRAALGLEDFYMLGHSAGGWVAIEYALTHPGHLRGLVLSNTNASVRSWLEYTDQVVAEEAPPDVNAKLRDCKARGDGDCYDALSGPYMQKRYLDIEPPLDPPWPAAVAVACFGRGSSEKMGPVTLGVPAFKMAGTVSGWDRWKDLDRIDVPTLVLASRRDIHSPADEAKIAARIPGATLAMLERGSHSAMYDNQEGYFGALVHFIEGVEAHGRTSKEKR